jgi:diguanylate cyclase (GGDEF)-like protein
VAADLPPTPDLDLEGMHSDVAETFAGAIRRTAALAGKADLEAITDSLTGLYSHRYVHERLGEEIERAREDSSSVTLLLCDIDDFRAFNGEHGYDEGDRALRAVALVVEECLRGVDLAGRYGGDEFAAILIGTDGTGAGEVAERLRRAVAVTSVTASGHRLTASIGFATFPEDAAGREELADKAEWARQRAKRTGRDTVVGFGAWRRVGAATRPAD